jgi:hypothetical protein
MATTQQQVVMVEAAWRINHNKFGLVTANERRKIHSFVQTKAQSLTATEMRVQQTESIGEDKE